MKKVFTALVLLFLFLSLLWAVFNGIWEAAFVTQADYGEHRYLMDLDVSPIWSTPDSPAREEFISHFSTKSEPFRETGRIEVYHNWSWWILNLIMIWLVGALVISPISMLCFRTDRWLGVLGRVSTSLIFSSALCFLLWLAVGGWGPPFPLGFGILGLIGGGIWSATFLRKLKQNSEQIAGGNGGQAATPQL